METIVLFLAELFGAFWLLVPALIALAVFVVVLASPILPLPALRRWTRRIVTAALVLFTLVLVLVILANTLFFETIVRRALRGLESQGIHADFESAFGNLLAGAVHIKKLHLTRSNDERSDFDLEIGELDVDLDIEKLLHKEFLIETAHAAHIRGRHERKSKTDDDHPARFFTVALLKIEDLQLEIIDSSTPNRRIELPLEIANWSTQPLQSNHAVFDVLFRSTGSGKVGDGSFQVSSTSNEQGRLTTWKMDEMPLHLAASWLGGPFRWLREGRIDVELEDRWELPNDANNIHCHVRCDLHEFRVGMPDTGRPLLQVLAEPLAEYLNQNSAHLPLEFELTVNRDMFESRMSVPVEEILGIIADNLAREFSERSGVKVEEIREVGQEVRDLIKGLFNRRRRNRE